MVEDRLSGLPMTDPHKRIGAKSFDASSMMQPPSMPVRQVDAGLWKGPAALSETERTFIRYLKLQKTLNPHEKLIATRGEFLKAVENAYKVGKGMQ